MLIPYDQTKKNSKMSKADLQAYMQKKREDDEQPVAGIFENKENPGKEQEFSYKWWPDQPNMKFILQDGERTTITKGAMNWINSRGTPQFEHLSTNTAVGAVQSGYTASPNGNITKEPYRVKSMKPRFKFSPTSYYPGMFEDDVKNMHPDLVVVEPNPAFTVTNVQAKK